MKLAPEARQMLRGLARATVAACAALLAAASPAQTPQAAATCPPTAQVPTSEELRAAQAAARDRGMLWRISKNGRDSWLYGTIHLGRLEWMFPGPKVGAAIAGADTVALELDLTDERIQQSMLASPALRGRPLALPAATAERLARQADAACLPAGALEALHPVMQAVMLGMLASRWDGLDASFAQELGLAGIARARGRQVVSLETVDQQMGALIPADAQQALAVVTGVLDQLDAGVVRQSSLRLAQAWEEGRLDVIEDYERWCECVRDEEDRRLLRRLNDERNPNLAARIDALHARGQRVFAAVGALHMTGPRALPALLAQRGYRVERVDFAR
jgi:hypothetical protein